MGKLFGLLFNGFIKIMFFINIEASKIVMRYVAAVSGHGEKVDNVKEQLLQSNPVLEGIYAIIFSLLTYLVN